MAKEQKITPIRQYNIDTIRRLRLELDITGEELSAELDKSLKYIGHIESPAHNAFHTDGGMNQIAIYFSKVAKERQFELNKVSGNITKLKTEYTIYDFYPKNPLPEVLEIKTSSPIPREGGVTATLNALLETSDFFDAPRKLKEIVDHFNHLQNKNWKDSDFTATLERAWLKGKLKRTDLPDGSVRYQKA